MGHFRTTHDNLAERFWSKVDVRSEDECWEWRGSRHREYGAFWLPGGLIPNGVAHGRMHPATRVAVYLTAGRWPASNLDACHTCDNPPCVNPNHLWLGTEAENIQDMIKKGRANHIGAPGGERHPGHKLTDLQVAEATARARSGESLHALAEEFGVTSSLIHAYRKGIRRKDITAVLSG